MMEKLIFVAEVGRTSAILYAHTERPKGCVKAFEDNSAVYYIKANRHSMKGRYEGIRSIIVSKSYELNSLSTLVDCRAKNREEKMAQKEPLPFDDLPLFATKGG